MYLFHQYYSVGFTTSVPVPSVLLGRLRDVSVAVPFQFLVCVLLGEWHKLYPFHFLEGFLNLTHVCHDSSNPWDGVSFHITSIWTFAWYLDWVHKVTVKMYFMKTNYTFITLTILDIIHRPVFYLKHDISENGLCVLQVEPNTGEPNKKI
jgi:hypothetical protein